MKRNALVLLLVPVIFIASCGKDTPLIPQPTMTEIDDAPYEYNDHTDYNEAIYKTVLSDTSALKENKRAIAQKELAADWSWMNSITDLISTKDSYYSLSAQEQ